MKPHPLTITARQQRYEAILAAAKLCHHKDGSLAVADLKHEHPDIYNELLGDRVPSTIHSQIATMKKLGLFKSRQTVIAAQPAPSNGNGHHKPAAAPCPSSLNYCPCCGFHVGALIKAVNALNGGGGV